MSTWLRVYDKLDYVTVKRLFLMSTWLRVYDKLDYVTVFRLHD